MNGSDPVTILIADDHPMFRKGLRDVIAEDETLRVLAEAVDGQEAISLVEQLHPDIAVLDLNMPEKSGLDVTRHIMRMSRPARVLILTMYNEEAMFNKAVDLGVRGYILKDSAVLDIVEGIRSVARGEYYFSPAMPDHLKPAARETTRQLAAAIDQLTDTERRVLRRISQSRTIAEIASEIQLSPRMVEGHRKDICDKLGLSGAYVLVRFALQHRDLF